MYIVNGNVSHSICSGRDQRASYCYYNKLVTIKRLYLHSIQTVVLKTNINNNVIELKLITVRTGGAYVMWYKNIFEIRKVSINSPVFTLTSRLDK